MKFFYRKILTVLLLLFFAFNAKAVNDTLTIRQAFDWSVGDTFVYRGYSKTAFSFPVVTYGALRSFTVLARANYADSIVYQLHYFNPDTITTAQITKLDSQVTAFEIDNQLAINFWGYIPRCDSLATWCAQYSHIDSINSFVTVDFSYSNPDGSRHTTYKERIGVFENSWLGHGFQVPPIGGGLVLTYYSSGSFSWMDSTLYFYTGIAEQTPAPTFRLYPNPTTDELTITTETNEPVDVFVYDMLGNELRSLQNSSANSIQVKVSDLSEGYYLLKLTSSHGSSSTKGFIIAR